jgi:hypothetical protein
VDPESLLRVSGSRRQAWRASGGAHTALKCDVQKPREAGKATKLLDIAGLGGVSVSPDGRWILYTQFDQAGSELMLMENFR